MSKLSNTIKDISPVIIPAGLLIGGFIFGKKILEFIGLSKDKGEQVGEQLSKVKQFNPNYWKGTMSASAQQNILNKWQAAFTQRADTIYNAKGYLYDDETAAVGAIKSCISALDVSLLSYCFQIKYSKDLYSYLETFLESENWLVLKTFFASQPDHL